MSGLSLIKRTVPAIQYHLFEEGCKRFNSVGLSVEPGKFFLMGARENKCQISQEL